MRVTIPMKANAIGPAARIVAAQVSTAGTRPINWQEH